MGFGRQLAGVGYRLSSMESVKGSTEQQTRLGNVAYTFDDIQSAYAEAGVSRGKVVLLKTDLRFLGPYAEPERQAVLDGHFRALSELVDLSMGTIVVHTASTYLCNTDTPYAPNNTTSERGALTEYIRTLPGAVRSYHPFMSYTAIGAHADCICKDVSRHAFGLETPKSRMLDLDAMYLSVGASPSKTCSYVHHMEMLMGVPYRYTKEFEHPILQPDGSVKRELFYMFVWYRDMDLNRDANRKLFAYCEQAGLDIRESALGRGRVWGYSCTDFCKYAGEFLRDDIYGWTTEPPVKRPYRI